MTFYPGSIQGASSIRDALDAWGESSCREIFESKRACRKKQIGEETHNELSGVFCSSILEHVRVVQCVETEPYQIEPVAGKKWGKYYLLKNCALVLHVGRFGL